MPIVPAPNVGTYSTRTQYVTAAEFKAAPTGVDTSQLVPGGSVAANTQALEMQLQRASAMADNWCRQVIAATVNTQAGSYRVQFDQSVGNVVKVPLNFTPILAVSDVMIGPTPGSLVELGDYSNIWIGKKSATIPVGTIATRLFARVQYVNGYANTALTTAPAIGDMALTVASPLGIMPGQQLNVQGGTNGETVTVDPVWVPQVAGINVTVPITTPLVNAYLPGDTVTAFPQDIKQAIILIAKSLILTPGDQSIVIPTYMGQPTQTQSLTPSVASDLDMAAAALTPYRRAV